MRKLTTKQKDQLHKLMCINVPFYLFRPIKPIEPTYNNLSDNEIYKSAIKYKKYMEKEGWDIKYNAMYQWLKQRNLVNF
jgi:hypothetical protein